ncbi:MAG: sugar ABC transporter ATP-binding protein [Luteibacter sp.]
MIQLSTASPNGGPSAAHAPVARALLGAHGIVKRFGPVEVLRGVDLELRPGRILTLMGENGAGKSTMFRILAGQLQPSAGALSLNGEPLRLPSPHAAHAVGIHLVPQEPMLLPELTVAETMFLGRLPMAGSWFRHVDWKDVRRRAGAVLDMLGLDIDIDRYAKTLSIAQLQLVECAKALLHDCRIILFDEPTSPLTAHEVDNLFAIMRRLAADGCTLSFISHRTEEVLAISDDIAVLRDGQLVDRAERGQFDRARLLSKMVGRTLRDIPRRELSHATSEPVLEVEGLASEPTFRGIGFRLCRGEILGLAGLVGAGRTEIAETIFGVRRPTAGSVRLAGDTVTGTPCHDLIRKGLVYVPEDRARHGAVLSMSIAQNVTSGLLERVRQSVGLLSDADETRLGTTAVRDFRVRCAGLDQPLRELSGGNQQKVVFSKWIATGPKVAILDEPTRGVDVGSKEEIYELIEAMARDGMAVLVISSETEELVRLCDRILSIYEGELVAELRGDEITPTAVSASYLGSASTGDAG